MMLHTVKSLWVQRDLSWALLDRPTDSEILLLEFLLDIVDCLARFLRVERFFSGLPPGLLDGDAFRVIGAYSASIWMENMRTLS